MSKYRDSEKERVPEIMCFNGDCFNGEFNKITRDFVLSDWKNNFYKPILTDVLDYFKHNNISWWNGKEPTGHVLSSQIACINHLFAIRKDRDAVLAVAKTICNDIEDVLPIPTDNYLSAFIAFEAVSDNDLLKEGIPTRGSNCTSIDALILAKNKDKKVILIPIEWKYTEYYDNTDKSMEDGQGHAAGSQRSGIVRLSRYSDLINKSTQLKEKHRNYTSTIYFFEPFYQLMRQTLWTEQMIKYKQNERIKADDFIHVHVILCENHDLLKDDLKENKRKKGYGDGKSLEEAWRSCLKNNDKYKIISPKDLLINIDKTKHNEIISYLSERYWK